MSPTMLGRDRGIIWLPFVDIADAPLIERRVGLTWVRRGRASVSHAAHDAYSDQEQQPGQNRSGRKARQAAKTGRRQQVGYRHGGILPDDC